MKKSIIVLAAVVLLGGLAWYFIGGRTGKPATTPMPTQMHHETHNMAAPAATVTCPVTGNIMTPGQEYSKTVYNGNTYYFCCAGCPEKFKKNPEKYIKGGMLRD